MEDFSMFEDCYLHEINIEFTFEEWPLLATLSEESQRHLCAAVSDSLASVDCKVHAIRAKPDMLRLVLKVDAALSIDEVANRVAVAGKTVATDPGAEEGPLSYSAESLSPGDIIDAVLRLRS